MIGIDIAPSPPLKREERNKALIADYQATEDGEYVFTAKEVMRKYDLSSGRFYAILKAYNVPTTRKK